MGQFKIVFNEYINPLIYDNHTRLEYYACTEVTSIVKSLSLDDTSNSNNFTIGYNYSSTSLPKDLVITSFTDIMLWTDPTDSTTVVPAGFIPDKLIDGDTGLELIYPYTKSISLIGSIYTFNESVSPLTLEFYCVESPKLIAKRERVLEYYVIDSAGNIGPIKQARLEIEEAT